MKNDISRLKLMKINQIIRSNNITSKDLDDIVTDVALAQATSVNNKGMQAQVDYIMESTDPDRFIKILSDKVSGLI